MRFPVRARSLLTLLLITSATFGFASTASAAPFTDASATSSAEIGIAGTNATPITVSATSVSGGPANMFNVTLPTGWSFVTPAANCSDMTLVGFSASPFCQKINFGSSNGFATIQLVSGTFTAGQTISITFAASSVNVAGTRNFIVELADSQTGGTAVDSGTAVLAGGITQSTVIFDANGGAGAIANLAGSSAAPLTANTFTRSGYTFSGWNTAADGSGTAYADGASYAFTASTTLYAQWTAVLAQTGNQTVNILNYVAWLLMSGSVLFAVGLVNRKLSNN